LATDGITVVASMDGLRDCHALTLHCPLTAATAGIVNESVFEMLAPGAIVVNTARGPLIDTQALVCALSSGRVAGVGLDTLDPEPLPADHELLSFPNVIITPHVAWRSQRALRKLQRETALEAARFLAGKPLRSAVPIGG
jgi:phosphoglycerate dehydrogenase-like enzyme